MMKMNNINKKGDLSNYKGFELLTITELNLLRGGISEDKGTSKEKDIYDTRET
jgi:hypothetical protein